MGDMTAKAFIGIDLRRILHRMAGAFAPIERRSES
jgi:hypothetical protein